MYDQARALRQYITYVGAVFGLGVHDAIWVPDVRATPSMLN